MNNINIDVSDQFVLGYTYDDYFDNIIEMVIDCNNLYDEPGKTRVEKFVKQVLVDNIELIRSEAYDALSRQEGSLDPDDDDYRLALVDGVVFNILNDHDCDSDVLKSMHAKACRGAWKRSQLVEDRLSY